MSMEAFVLSHRRLDSVVDWQRAIDGAGFSVQLMTERAFLSLSGHLPAQWRETEAGFECGHGDAAELIAAYPEIAFHGRWKHLLALRWSTLPACAAAYLAGAAYARATNGVVFDPQEARLMTPQEVHKVAIETEAAVPLVEQRLAELARGRRSPGARGLWRSPRFRV
jgi:hypothetical protein